MTRTPKCPICGKDVAAIAPRPFCSRRCADVDLGRWLKGSYVIPGASSEESEDTPADPEPRDHEP